MELASRITLWLVLAAVLGYSVAWLLATVRHGMQLSQLQSEWELTLAELRAEVRASRERERVLAAAQKSMEGTYIARERLLAGELEERRVRLLSLVEAQSRMAGSQADLDSRLAHCQSALAQRATELEEAVERVRQLEPLSHRIAELQQEVRELGQLAVARASANQELQRHLAMREAESEAAQRRLAQLQEEHRAVLRQRDDLAGVETRYLTLLAEREAEAARAAEQFCVAPLDVTGSADLRGEQAARARLQARLGELEPLTGRVRDLERQLASSERSRTELVRDLESEIRALRARIADLESGPPPGRPHEPASFAGQGGRSDAAGAMVEVSAAADERRLALEAEVAVLREVVASRNREIADLRAAAEADTQPVAPLARAARPRPKPAPEADDLKLIRGIGPVLERLLHRIGVTRFRQIARWSDRDVARVGRQLEGFPDRIRRDRWVESARREYIRKYGRDPTSGEWLPPRR